MTELHQNRVGVIPGPEHSASVPPIGADVPSVLGICGLLVSLCPWRDDDSMSLERVGHSK